MKILLDECVDWRMARLIAGHDVKSARQMGWTAVQNGRLLALASEYFDIFVTVDRSLGAQQNLDRFAIAILVLHAHTNRLADLAPLVPKLLVAIEKATSRHLIIVGG